ncbi:hypothetical protein U6J73_01595 [Cutibacterium acnes]|jgi:hypothetical protein|uniref:hypothetical protein n=1 Tax=Cutibacterium TaxID=1912216 RepID=UPI0001F08F5A|nr:MULTISPECIES: hypothetical protein [Cutibacterium]EFT11003.1 hypothetical protein HMPREF9619_00864 [Cutibacterium acnes HL082PA2]ERS32626.1 hypothetical protein HMPREF1277_00896 [Propionibacterium sp. KPL1847]ERS67187.1 hypothetical protein HMPREF1278_00745 [Propionibacterium sp. KPL1849]MCU7485169.1 hypothetical protein [Cutibacterium acnes 19B2]MCU7487479.1 hypothetical protein [Cutibacterium acnes 19B1]MCW5114442.1 hypothetical protein [Cutibacterium acnes P05]
MVCNGIATIVSTLARLQQGHEMQIAHTHVAEVIEVVAYTFEGAGEMVGIGCITDHRRLLKPVGLQEAGFVEALEIIRTFGTPL